MVIILKITALWKVTLYILNEVRAHVLQIPLKLFDDFLENIYRLPISYH